MPRPVVRIVEDWRGDFRGSGTYVLPAHTRFHFDSALPSDSVILPLAARLKFTANVIGIDLELVTDPAHSRLALRAFPGERAPVQSEGYYLGINSKGVTI